MKTQNLLTTIIIALFGVIVVLGYTILAPQPPEPTLNFDYVISQSALLRNKIQSVNITYEVELVTPSETITGYMTYQRTLTDKKVILSPELNTYAEKDLLLGPDQLVEFIQNSTRREYAGDLVNEELNKTCWSLNTEPYNEEGEYIFVTCIDQETGYPSINYNGELVNNEMTYSNIYITNINYETR